MNVYDWNLRDTGKDYTIPGGTCRNNVYKMCMMLISLNPNLVKQLYLQPGNEIIKDMKIDGIYKALSSRENLYQSLDLCRQVVQQYEDTVAVYKARMNTLEKLNTILAAYKEHVEKMNASNKIKNERERIQNFYNVAHVPLA